MTESETTRPITPSPQTPQEMSQTETIPVIPEKKQKPWLVIGLTVLLILSLGAIGYFVYQNYRLKKDQQVVPLEPYPTETKPTSMPTIDLIANWKTYTNKEYRFSFKYPQNYTFEEIPVPTSNYVQIIFNVGQESGFVLKARKDYLPNDVFYFLDTPSSGQRMIGENIWSTYFIPADKDIKSIYGFQLEKNNFLYSLSFPNGTEPTSEQIKIISTIKLADDSQATPIPTPTVYRRNIPYRMIPGWPLYKSLLGFDFQYPPDYSSPQKELIDFMNQGQFYCSFTTTKKVGTGLDFLNFMAVPKNYENNIERTLKILNAPGYLSREEITIDSYPSVLLDLDQSYSHFAKDQVLIVEVGSMLLIAHFQQNEINQSWSYILESIRTGDYFNKQYFQENLNNCRN